MGIQRVVLFTKRVVRAERVLLAREDVDLVPRRESPA